MKDAILPFEVHRFASNEMMQAVTVKAISILTSKLPNGVIGSMTLHCGLEAE